jgi:mRNA interferase RelE/StbE
VYEVLLEAHAERDLRRLSAREFRRITAAIRRLGVDPRPAGCRKIVGSESDWRIRVGEYRIIYEIDDRAMAVRVMRVRHRRDAYR